MTFPKQAQQFLQASKQASKNSGIVNPARPFPRPTAHSALGLFIALGLAPTLLLSPDAALAADRTWIGGNDNWITDANWSGGTVPTTGDTALIDTDVTVTIGASESGDIGAGDFYLGSGGGSALSITSGGTLITGVSRLGGSTGTTGTVTVDGTNSSWTNDQLYVGRQGTGVLNITNGGTVSTTSAITAGVPYGTGTINIGTGAAAGFLDAPSISGGSNGTTTLNFNHTAIAASPYYFTRDGLALGTGVNLSGNINLTNTDGYTVLTGADNRTSGTTTISAGRLVLSGNASIASPSGVTLSSNAYFDISAISGASTTIKGLHGSGGDVYLGGKNLTIDNDTDNTYNGSICSGCGGGSLTKTGNGTLTLTGSNNLPNGTTVSNGTLQIGNNTTTGSIVGNITTTSTNANVTFKRSNNVNYDFIISGSGSLTQAGSGKLTLDDANTYTGVTTISAGTLALGTYGSIAESIGVVIGASGTFDISGISGFGITINGLSGEPGSKVNLGYRDLTVTQSTPSTFAGNITGNTTSNLYKGGAETLTLSGANNSIGSTTINAGTLKLAATGRLVSDVTVEDTAGATLALRGGSVVTGYVDLGGSNSTLNAYQGSIISGDLTTTGGKLNFFLPSGIDNNDTLLTVTGNANIGGSKVTLALDGGAPSLTVLTEGESIKLITTGTGITGDISNPGNKTTLKAGASFSADFSLSTDDGYNLVAKRDATPVPPPPPSPPPPPPARTTPADLIWTGATDRNWNILTSENWTHDFTFINGDTVTFTDTGFGQVNIVTPGVAPAATTFTNTQGHDYRVSGTLSGTGTLTKTGNGNLTLTGNNTYSGNTIINAGSLTLALSGALPNTNVSIASPATFNLYNRVGKNLTLANAARLNAYQGAAITGNLTAIGSQLNFYLPTIATNGYSLLNVGGTANITGSTVNVGILGSSSPLTAGDTVTLINANSLTGNPANTIAHGTGMQGVSLLYDFDLTTNGKQLLATVAGDTPPIDPNPPVAPNPPVTPPVDPNPPTDPNPPVTPPTNPGINLNPQTKALAEGFLSGTAFLNQAQDFAAERGIHSALQTVQSSDKHGFAAIGYSTLRHNTGSHVDVDGYTLLAGLAATTPTQTGNLTTAAFIEHGEGNYDSYNSFSNAASVHGKGDTQYTGAGILARFAFDETQAAPLYLDASIRSGKVKTDFSGNLYDGFGRAAAYNAKSTYVSAHVGVGYVVNLTEQSKLDIYGQYLWSHQNGDTVKLTTGETVKFEAVDSQRTKLGAKWHHTLTTKTTAYVGAAWEHEYNAKANASIYGYKLDAPKLKGDTGVLEAGLTLTPTAANQQGWSLDLGVQGYAGKREGVTGSVRARYRF
ncbi:hypothetical protein AGMMS50289_07250 [Betaproteobacteria bacterium]|nr:hypothetical protein AGMMS50289_07250 [Betaproteobacteria bacterium]